MRWDNAARYALYIYNIDIEFEIECGFDYLDVYDDNQLMARYVVVIATQCRKTNVAHILKQSRR